IAAVDGGLQEAGWVKKSTKGSLLAGPVNRGRGVTLGQYLDSFYENRANMFKELEHAINPETGKFADPRYAAAKAANYNIRELDGINQAGISLKGAVSEGVLTDDIIDLTVKIANDKDKLDVVEHLLKGLNPAIESGRPVI